MFSSGGTDKARRAANCIMLEGNLEARIWSIVRPIVSVPGSRLSMPGTILSFRRKFQIVHRKLKFSRDPIRLAPEKFVQQSTIVPKSAIAATIEPCPERFPRIPVIGENRTHIVQLVRR